MTPPASSPTSTASALKKMSIGLRSRRVLFLRSGQPAVLDAKDGVGRHDIDVVDLDRHAVGGDMHRQIRIAAHDLMQETFPVGTEMGHDDEREPRLWRQAAKKSLKRFDAASRRAKADDGKVCCVGHVRGLRDRAATPLALAPVSGRLVRPGQDEGCDCEASLSSRRSAALTTSLDVRKRPEATCAEMKSQSSPVRDTFRVCLLGMAELRWVATSATLAANEPVSRTGSPRQVPNHGSSCTPPGSFCDGARRASQAPVRRRQRASSRYV